MTQAVDEVDIIIVGGGLMGLALLLLLCPLGYRVRLLEARPLSLSNPDILDTRSIALAPASVSILKALGVWPALVDKAAGIQQIHISEQGHFGQARLQSEAPDSPLGTVVEMHLLEAALKAHIEPKNILAPARVVSLNATSGEVTFETETGDVTLRSTWIIAADGADSPVRGLLGLKADKKIYSEYAIATNIALARPHKGVAYERFTSTGPLALLPLKGLYMALVWTLPSDEANALKHADEGAFLTALQRAFGYRAGRFLKTGKRMTYPLQQVLMSSQVYERVVFVGNAAHTLHPVAGQGFNLGLRDIAMLAECIAKHGLTKLAQQAYQQNRKSDQELITKATDGLVSLFKNPLPGVGLARRLGLVALDNSPFLKRVLLRHAKGYGGMVPDVVRGVALDMQKEVRCVPES